MWFNDYNEAKAYADQTNQPLWDTYGQPNRYYVGHLPIEVEDGGYDWEELT